MTEMNNQLLENEITSMGSRGQCTLELLGRDARYAHSAELLSMIYELRSLKFEI